MKTKTKTETNFEPWKNYFGARRAPKSFFPDCSFGLPHVCVRQNFFGGRAPTKNAPNHFIMEVQNT